MLIFLSQLFKQNTKLIVILVNAYSRRRFFVCMVILTYAHSQVFSTETLALRHYRYMLIHIHSSNNNSYSNPLMYHKINKFLEIGILSFVINALNRIQGRQNCRRYNSRQKKYNSWKCLVIKYLRLNDILSCLECVSV